MLIALCIALGVDLIVIVVFVAVIVGRRRWLKRQPGSFRGAIRVSDGAIDGLNGDWKRGSGRWVRDVLVWSPARSMFRNVLVPVDKLDTARPAGDGEVKRLGDEPVVIEFSAPDGKLEIASKPEDRPRLVGSFVLEDAG